LLWLSTSNGLAYSWVVNIADRALLGFQLYLHKLEWQIPETLSWSNSLYFKAVVWKKVLGNCCFEKL